MLFQLIAAVLNWFVRSEEAISIIETNQIKSKNAQHSTPKKKKTITSAEDMAANRLVEISSRAPIFD